MGHEGRTKDPLALAIESFRSNSCAPERLSSPRRAAIIDGALGGGSRSRRLSPLFAPWGRWAATVVPVAVVTLGLGWLSIDREPARAASVEVAKVGDQVVFKVANGGKPHRIFKSDRPDRFDRGASVQRSDGVFSDRLDSGADIVFYRID